MSFKLPRHYLGQEVKVILRVMSSECQDTLQTVMRRAPHICVFPQTYDWSPIMRKHKTNPDGGTFCKTPDLSSHWSRHERQEMSETVTAQRD